MEQWVCQTTVESNRPVSQIPEYTCSISCNAPFRTEMCTFLFWMEHCGIWNRCILGFVSLVNCSAINFVNTIHKRHPIAHHSRRAMGYLFWVQCMGYFLPLWLPRCEKYFVMIDPWLYHSCILPLATNIHDVIFFKISGSGHGTVAVLLPVFAINW